MREWAQCFLYCFLFLHAVSLFFIVVVKFVCFLAFFLLPMFCPCYPTVWRGTKEERRRSVEGLTPSFFALEFVPMVKRDLEKERQLELAAIWGSETDGDLRYPRRRRNTAKQPTTTAAAAAADADGASDVLSLGSDAVSESGGSDRGALKKKREKKGKKALSAYRLHCFVAPGTERNAVRTVFDAYEPKVEIRVSQKGNLLNKTHYAVLTFRNKAMALHSVKMLDGTDQRELLGVKELKLGLMLSRKEQNASRRSMRKRLHEERERKMVKETEEDVTFIKNFMNLYAPSG
ncbi:hypothetical protein, conserved [Trypanosoma cruzi]|uniref:RRM domain-containing protein n=2 Tax=Trypanosoma cruzi TaxID=5693 RepID=Q4DC66_TRYCC|nr:hypothetical protein, conserved [Trypanosoma cruzi]EAN90125.1 hypothetical protein, conserved [Trypanosoma cruzi]|eukprot:XP_811976.1 hypothetical protein [Trypanosoma cruzi strain CL Brener]